MPIVNSTHEVEWDKMGNGEFATLLVEYEWNTDTDSLVICSVVYEGLEWIDYLNAATRNYLRQYMKERLEK
jgi:hypothetical protein